MFNNPMQLMSMLQNSNNPMAMLTQMFSNNPQFKTVLDIVQSKNPQELEMYVKNLCKNQNIDINQLASKFGFTIK